MTYWIISAWIDERSKPYSSSHQPKPCGWKPHVVPTALYPSETAALCRIRSAGHLFAPVPKGHGNGHKRKRRRAQRRKASTRSDPLHIHTLYSAKLRSNESHSSTNEASTALSSSCGLQRSLFPIPRTTGRSRLGIWGQKNSVPGRNLTVELLEPSSVRTTRRAEWERGRFSRTEPTRTASACGPREIAPQLCTLWAQCPYTVDPGLT